MSLVLIYIGFLTFFEACQLLLAPERLRDDHHLSPCIQLGDFLIIDGYHACQLTAATLASYSVEIFFLSLK